MQGEDGEDGAMMSTEAGLSVARLRLRACNRDATDP